MNLKFWKRGKSDANGMNSKLPRPKELPDQVGMYLVTRLKEDPDWVWSLRAAMRPREENRRIHDIRIYDPASAASQGVTVQNYTSLDDQVGLILFSGSINKDTGKVQLEKAHPEAA